MTTNPLAERRAAASTPRTGGLRAWCDELNASRLAERMGRWYYVRKTGEGEQIDTLEGVDGANVRLLLAGKLPDFYGWPKARMDGYRNWLRSVAEAGRFPLDTAA